MRFLPSQSFREFLSPAGAGIVLICFFLPWLRVSCGARKMTLAGPDLGGVFYVVLGTAIIMLLAFSVLAVLKKSGLSRLVLLAGSALSLGIIVFKSVQVALDPNIPFYIPERMIGFELKAGAYGTIGGLIMALFGALHWGGRGKRAGKKPENEDA